MVVPEKQPKRLLMPDEMREKLAPLIVQVITDKLKKSGVNVTREEIEKLVKAQDNDIEIAAISFPKKKFDPINIKTGPVIVCIPPEPWGNLKNKFGGVVVSGGQ